MKQLMGEGISRNKAAKLASTYRLAGFPYIVGFVDHQLGFHSVTLKEHIKAITEVLEGIKEETGKECHTFDEMIDALLKLRKQLPDAIFTPRGRCVADAWQTKQTG